jgi:hypothetical protein
MVLFMFYKILEFDGGGGNKGEWWKGEFKNDIFDTL